jgi:hypothetical protein
MDEKETKSKPTAANPKSETVKETNSKPEFKRHKKCCLVIGYNVSNITRLIRNHRRFKYTRKAFKWHNRNCGAGIKTMNQKFGSSLSIETFVSFNIWAKQSASCYLDLGAVTLTRELLP